MYVNNKTQSKDGRKTKVSLTLRKTIKTKRCFFKPRMYPQGDRYDCGPRMEVPLDCGST